MSRDIRWERPMIVTDESIRINKIMLKGLRKLRKRLKRGETVRAWKSPVGFGSYYLFPALKQIDREIKDRERRQKRFKQRLKKVI